MAAPARQDTTATSVAISTFFPRTYRVTFSLPTPGLPDHFRPFDWAGRRPGTWLHPVLLFPHSDGYSVVIAFQGNKVVGRLRFANPANAYPTPSGGQRRMFNVRVPSKPGIFVLQQVLPAATLFLPR